MSKMEMALGHTETGEELGVSAVLRALEEDIALGVLRPRERLVEDELISRFGVKRHVIRQALVDLEAMGVVSRQPNKGATVRDFHPKEVEDLYLVRELLERKCAELIPLPAPQAVIDDLDAIHRRHQAAAEAGDLRTVFRENLRFHKVIYASSGNEALAQATAQFADKTHAIRSYTIGDKSLLNAAVEQHAAIILALRGENRDRLVTLIVEHLSPAKQAYLERTKHLHRPQ